VEESCPLPTEMPPQGPAATRERLEELRRFHFGDPAARPTPPPAGSLPAAFAALGGAPAAGDWPLVIEAEADEAPFARSLGDWLGAAGELAGPLGDRLGELAARVAARADDRGGQLAGEAIVEAAAELGGGDEVVAAARGLVAPLGATTLLVGFGPAAVRTLFELAARRRHRVARAAIVAEARGLIAALDGVLESDAGRKPAGAGAAAQAGRLGALGGRLLDPARLAEVTARRPSGRVLDDRRRAALEEARERLAAIGEHAVEPLWIAAGDDDPFGRAILRFDAAAEATVPLVRALRRARLEAAQAFEPERHEPWLERLDWRSFDERELALVPPIFVPVALERLAGDELPAFTRLLLSGRPLEIIVERPAATPGDSLAGFEPGLLGIVLGSSFVQQGSLAAGAALASAIERGLAAARPALHLLEPWPAAVGDLDPWWIARARLLGRAAPAFVHDPTRGTSWASRIDLGADPEPLADWPEREMPDAAVAAGAPGRALFTFADAALLDPAWHAELALAPESPELLPFADWLALEETEAVRRLPFVWVAPPAAAPARYVVSRTLARAALGRLAFWRSLEELAGVRSEHLDRSLRAARDEERRRADEERDTLAEQHAAELEQIRATSDGAAVERLVGALLGLGAGSRSKSDPEGGGIP